MAGKKDGVSENTSNANKKQGQNKGTKKHGFIQKWFTSGKKEAAPVARASPKNDTTPSEVSAPIPSYSDFSVQNQKALEDFNRMTHYFSDENTAGCCIM